jgi:hypothetical protein
MSPQPQALGCDVATLDQLGIPLDDFERRLLSFTPKANVKHMLADAKIMDGKIRKPCRKIWVNVEFVVRRSR